MNDKEKSIPAEKIKPVNVTAAQSKSSTSSKSDYDREKKAIDREEKKDMREYGEYCQDHWQTDIQTVVIEHSFINFSQLLLEFFSFKIISKELFFHQSHTSMVTGKI